MAVTTELEQQKGIRGVIQRLYGGAPLLGMLLGFLICTLWEQLIGEILALARDFRDPPEPDVASGSW